MERFNRAERRAQVARIKAKRKYYWGHYRPGGRDYSGEKISELRLGMLVHTAQHCSCPMCGNDRQLYGRTLPELMGIISMEEQLDELS